jgi:hypothetical protein
MFTTQYSQQSSCGNRQMMNALQMMNELKNMVYMGATEYYTSIKNMKLKFLQLNGKELEISMLNKVSKV